MRLIRDGDKRYGGGGEGEYSIYLSLHCHHQNDVCINMGSLSSCDLGYGHGNRPFSSLKYYKSSVFSPSRLILIINLQWPCKSQWGLLLMPVCLAVSVQSCTLLLEIFALPQMHVLSTFSVAVSKQWAREHCRVLSLCQA